MKGLSSALVTIPAALGIGATLIAYWSFLPSLSTHPTVEVRTLPDGDLAPFIISNSGSWLSFGDVTPDCVVTWALWKTSGSIYEYWVDHKPPMTRMTMIGPGASTNFACDVKRVLSIPKAKMNTGEPIPVYLLEAKIRVRINYNIIIGPFKFFRVYNSSEYCGISRPDGIYWLSGDLIAPSDPISDDFDRQSFHTEYLSRCFTRDEVKNLLGFQGEVNAPIKNGGDYHFDVPLHGAFEH